MRVTACVLLQDIRIGKPTRKRQRRDVTRVAIFMVWFLT
jgi:hypothetical protein